MNKKTKETIVIVLAMFWSALWGVGFGLLINQNRYDVNKDGVVDARDYVEIKNYIMEE